tara:strand:- start:23 stop:925 length:903 start_codon:yes stop_codon:yes gene_type:complete
VSANSAVSPDGATTASTLTLQSGGYPSRFVTVTTVAATSYTVSVYAKAGTHDTLSLEWRGAGVHPDAVFNLSSGTVTAGVGTIVDCENGWFRCSMTEVSVDTSELFIIGGGSSMATDGTIFIYGAQIEEGAFPTSYIPTTGAAATRARDMVEIPTSAFGYNNDAGSLVIDVLTPVADQFMALAYFNTSSYLESRGSIKANYSGANVGNLYSGRSHDGTSTAIQLGAHTQAEYTKLGLSYGDSESGVRDGGTVLSGTSRYPNPTRLHLGGRDNGFQSQCWVKSIQYYPRQLTDTQLQELTT